MNKNDKSRGRDYDYVIPTPKPDIIYTRQSVLNNPDLELNLSRAIRKLGIDVIWLNYSGIHPVVMGICDNGVDPQHEDLLNQVTAFYNFTDLDSISESSGHGTHVAGIITALRNGKGVVGVNPDHPVIVARVLDAEGGFSSWVRRGIAAIADHPLEGRKIINLSLGGLREDPETSKLIDRVVLEKNCILVTAAGNESADELIHPAAHPLAISVGSVNWENKISEFSNYSAPDALYSEEIDIFCYGDPVISTYPGNNYANMRGTSMATPIVAGIIFRLCERFGDLVTIENLKQLLRETGTSVTPSGHPYDHKARIINPLALFAAYAQLEREQLPEEDLPETEEEEERSDPSTFIIITIIIIAAIIAALIS